MHSVWIVVAATLVTLATRFLPFLIFRGKAKTPDIIVYLGKVLPYAIMGMLVVYCLKEVRFTNLSSFLPELIAACVVCGSYIWKRNTLISIISGTLCYMALVQFVF